MQPGGAQCDEVFRSNGVQNGYGSMIQTTDTHADGLGPLSYNPPFLIGLTSMVLMCNGFCTVTNGSWSWRAVAWSINSQSRSLLKEHKCCLSMKSELIIWEEEWRNGNKRVWIHRQDVVTSRPFSGVWVVSGCTCGVIRFSTVKHSPSHLVLSRTAGVRKALLSCIVSGSEVALVGGVRIWLCGWWSRSRLSRWIARSMSKLILVSSSRQASSVRISLLRPWWKAAFSVGSF